MRIPIMMCKKLILILVVMCSFCLAENASAQDVHFSQFFEAPLLRNPSLAGIFTGDIRAQMVYRDQWNSFTNAYRTGSFNVEYKAPVGKSDDFLTIGLQALFDKAGTAGLTTTEVLPALNYHKSLRSDKAMYLSVGFMAGLVQKRIDRSKITTDNQFVGGAYNPAVADGETFTSPNYSYFDASVGTSFNTSFGAENQNNLFFGVGYHHLNRPSNSFYRSADAALHGKTVVSGGVKFNLDDYSYFTLQADYSKQGAFTETIAGVLYSYKLGDDYENPDYTVSGGAFLRWGDAFIPVLKIDYNPFAVAISYDVNVSTLKTVSQGRGGIEISVSYIGFLDRYNSSRDKVLCPKF
jgi:type IX secretion system PorP/SprF family membrane protein